MAGPDDAAQIHAVPVDFVWHSLPGDRGAG